MLSEESVKDGVTLIFTLPRAIAAASAPVAKPVTAPALAAAPPAGGAAPTAQPAPTAQSAPPAPPAAQQLPRMRAGVADDLDSLDGMVGRAVQDSMDLYEMALTKPDLMEFLYAQGHPQLAEVRSLFPSPPPP